MQRKLTDAEIAWLAGLYEGEGTAQLREMYVEARGTRHRTARVSITMTDRDVIERVHDLFPTRKGMRVLDRRKGKPHWKTQYQWNVSSRDDVARFLRLVLPWLGERRRTRALAVLEYAEDPYQGLGSQWRRKTHCPKGHPYDEENTRIKKRGAYMTRVCKTCSREWDRKRRELQKETSCPHP